MIVSKNKTILSILLLVFGIGILFYMQSPLAKPKVQWTPPKVDTAVNAGQSSSTTVKFTPSEDVSGPIDVRVVPELQPFATTSPTSFGSLTQGQEESVDINISTSTDDVPGVYDGTIQLKDGNKTVAKPLPVVTTILEFDHGLPPDPGEAGKETLEGIDSDGDGVRDDIQRYIALTYPDSEKARTALTQYTKVFQQELINAQDREAIRSIALFSERANHCLMGILGTREAYEAHTLIRAEILNTEERTSASFAADRHLGGMGSSVQDNVDKKTLCDFDPDLLEN